MTKYYIWPRGFDPSLFESEEDPNGPMHLLDNQKIIIEVEDKSQLPTMQWNQEIKPNT